jgi:hypothetical protein
MESKFGLAEPSWDLNSELLSKISLLLSDGQNASVAGRMQISIVGLRILSFLVADFDHEIH